MKNVTLKARSIDEIWSGYKDYRDSCEFIKVGIQELDNALNGGLPLGKILEIYGPSGSGKTQFALSVVSEILIKNGIHSNEVFSLYLYTNGTFPIQRLCEILG
ncbi:hypothetical protein BEWA_008590 [Theileria equi strain WA]|uniref:RecA family profile 1 domain-containing protein n=1 Tax=Theileria equi strain WA TaxID=1537102 RepID=L0B2X4_THEEQ|nr:hypothetical protein BEWA_008590 [Theileria equi strain WA]AFZ81449.1 hypothetical protein BEWA_008590 [Theileria equi strain WA]|eukprot:XP_004831115.1 hypothetical protein BEWA_008590 [Theileria equi strain WA]